jgi:hypothetical protein
MATGRVEVYTIAWLTDPSRELAIAPCPRVPTTITPRVCSHVEQGNGWRCLDERSSHCHVRELPADTLHGRVEDFMRRLVICLQQTVAVDHYARVHAHHPGVLKKKGPRGDHFQPSRGVLCGLGGVGKRCLRRCGSVHADDHRVVRVGDDRPIPPRSPPGTGHARPARRPPTQRPGCRSR